MKKCKNCGELNTAEAQFCDNCGKDAFIFNEELRCPHCGIANDISYTHCINCGNVLNTTAVAPTTAVSTLDMSEAVTDLRSELQQVYEGSMTNVTVKETNKCPNCGAEVQINSVYCYKCGTPVSSLYEHKVVNRKMCQHCHTPNLLTNTYCSYCYSELEDAPIEEFQLVYDTKLVGKNNIKVAMLQGVEGKYLMCNNCGALNSSKDTFCVHCGLKLIVEEQLRYCVHCGTENSVDDKFCVKCQWSFEGVAPESAGSWTCTKCNHLNSNEDSYCIHCGTAKKGKI